MNLKRSSQLVHRVIWSIGWMCFCSLRAATIQYDAATNLTDLINLSIGTNQQYAQLQGYHVAGDPGGGLFYWDPASTEATNRGTIFRSAIVTNAGRWKRLIKPQTVSVTDFGAKGDGTADDTTAVQDAINYFGPGTSGKVKLDSGTYRITSTITNHGIRDLEFIGNGAGSRYGNHPNSSTILYWAGPTNGVMWDIDRSAGLVLRNLHFQTFETNAAGVLLNIDTVGPGSWGSMSDILIENCSFTSHHTNQSHVFRAVQISTNSHENCEHIIMRDCAFQGDGYQGGSSLNNSVAIWIGENDNAKNILIDRFQGKYFTNFLHAVNGGVTVQHGLLDHCDVDFVVEGMADPMIFRHNRSEFNRQALLVGNGTGSTVIFDDNTYADTGKWTNTLPQIQITGGGVSLNMRGNVLGANNKRDMPIFGQTGNWSATLVEQNNIYATNNYQVLGLTTFTNALTQLGGSAAENTFGVVLSKPLGFATPGASQPQQMIRAAINPFTGFYEISLGELTNRLGIGTTIPAAKLQVWDVSPLQILFGDSSVSNRFDLFNSSSGDDSWFAVNSKSGKRAALRATDGNRRVDLRSEDPNNVLQYTVNPLIVKNESDVMAQTFETNGSVTINWVNGALKVNGDLTLTNSTARATSGADYVDLKIQSGMGLIQSSNMQVTAVSGPLNLQAGGATMAYATNTGAFVVTTNFEFKGSLTGPVSIVDSNWTITANSWTLIANTANSNLSWALPSTTGLTGQTISFKNISTNSLTISAASGDKIDLATSISLTNRFQAIELRCQGTNWWIF